MRDLRLQDAEMDIFLNTKNSKHRQLQGFGGICAVIDFGVKYCCVNKFV